MFVGCFEMLLLNISNMLELSGLFVCLMGLVYFFQCLGGEKKFLGCCALGKRGGISTQTDKLTKSLSLFRIELGIMAFYIQI